MRNRRKLTPLPPVPGGRYPPTHFQRRQLQNWSQQTITGSQQDKGSPLGVIARKKAYIGSGAMIIPCTGKALENGEGSTLGGNVTIISDLPASATANSSLVRIIVCKKNSKDPASRISKWRATKQIMKNHQQ